MSRRRRAKKRIILPDPTYQSILVHMIANRIMKNGKKALAYKLLYEILDDLAKETESSPLSVLEEAIGHVRPSIEVKGRRVGGAVLQIPLEVKIERGTVLAIQWLLSAARGRSGSTIVLKLQQELFDAFNQTGAAMKKRGEIQRMAEANKAFAKFRF